MIYSFYKELLDKYGKQGWWPLLDLQDNNSCLSENMRGYHPGNYSYPKTRKQRFEICVGAILTQNTSWQNVEKALINLNEKCLLSPAKILESSPEKLKEAIRSAGYFNQKAKKLMVFSQFFLQLIQNPKRDELLNLWGIGPETADSILLYAYNEPVFVVDTYTKRIFSGLSLINGYENYEYIRELFENNLPRDYRIFQEYHALIVEHSKNLKKNH
ncbi:MAG: endonuclease III domain-containing protein [Nanoarchaeota archaeon]